MEDLQVLEQELTATVNAANDLNSLEDIRVAALGKKGRVSLMMRELGKMTPEQRQDLHLITRCRLPFRI